MRRALAEDVLPLGDLSASLVPESARARFAFVARRDGVVAGSRCAIEAFALTDPAVSVVWLLPDASRVSAGDEIAVVEGPLAPILTAERTALNFLCHLSGVATLDASLRGRGRCREPGHAGPRHEEDHAGTALLGEGGCARGRRHQSPRQPVGGRSGEGQPPGGHRHIGRGRQTRAGCGRGAWWRSSARAPTR